jgi:hypothetical protein
MYYTFEHSRHDTQFIAIGTLGIDMVMLTINDNNVRHGTDEKPMLWLMSLVESPTKDNL